MHNKRASVPVLEMKIAQTCYHEGLCDVAFQVELPVSWLARHRKHSPSAAPVTG